jgi:hypothetical protein
MQWYEILALYLIFGVPGTIAYTLLEYQMYFKDRITYWQVARCVDNLPWMAVFLDSDDLHVHCLEDK